MNKKKEYRTPEVKKFITKLKSENPDLSYDIIAERVNQKFKLKMSGFVARNILEKEVAGDMLMNQESKNIFEADYNILSKRFREAGDWMEKLNKLYSELWEKYKDRPEVLLKLSPSIVNVQREILNQIDFAVRQQQRLLTQQKSIIYTPIQIVNIMGKRLLHYEKEGIIKILKPLPSEVQYNPNKKEDEDENDEQE